MRVDGQGGTGPVGQNFETYLETWDTSQNIDDLLDKMRINPHTILDISFCDFTFTHDGPGGKIKIGGLGDPTGGGGKTFTMEQLQHVIDKIHERGGKVKLALGGATYYSQGHLNAQTAKDIGQAVRDYNLDGIDLDIEDNPPSDQEIDFIKMVRREIGNDKILTLTVKGQDASVAPVIRGVKDIVDCFNFMEYCIWVPGSYADQIKSDILSYMSQDPPFGFGLRPSQIQVGLMPGDDTGPNGHFLTVADAQELARWAKEQGLAGVMTWDVDRDYKGKSGQKSLEYTNDIMDILFGARGKMKRLEG